MEFLEVGQIVNTHGIKGEVRVMSQTDFPEERFSPGSILFIGTRDGEKVEIEVRSGRPHKQFQLVAFENHPTIEDVERYKGLTLFILKQQVKPLQENSFYYHDILGCTVVSLNNETIGEVSDILETGANDVWEVKGVNGKNHYIPFIRDVVKEVDVANKRVVIDVLEGLLTE